jgi:hypothetical protein
MSRDDFKDPAYLGEIIPLQFGRSQAIIPPILGEAGNQICP